jgi:hypothetical protein
VSAHNKQTGESESVQEFFLSSHLSAGRKQASNYTAEWKEKDIEYAIL